ncbi:MAG: alanine racemase [Tissierellales bacterium]
MISLKNFRPVWVEINLDNLGHNLREIRRLVGEEVIITSVIKADGYGHGAVAIAKTLLDNGSNRFAVATLSEAIELRKSGIKEDILILGYTPECQDRLILENNISQTIYNIDHAKAISEAAKQLGMTAKIHLKIDTGMGRLGFLPVTHSVEEIVNIFKLPNLYVEGVFSHFAKADEADKEPTNIQFQKFNWLIKEIEKKGIEIPIKHIANSAAIIDLPEYHLDMVRPGIMLYGLYPSEQVKKESVDLKPVMTLKASVSNVKTLKAGEGISYGHNFVTDNETKIATLPIGYADGFTRLLNHKVEVSIKGKRIPIVGNICMDQCMANVSSIEDVKVGDTVTFFGDGSMDEPSVEEIANIVGTINYEMICMINKRVPRVYIKSNEPIYIKDYLA